MADAIRAESFNPRTLFLIGTYKIGKERLFLEVNGFACHCAISRWKLFPPAALAGCKTP